MALLIQSGLLADQGVGGSPRHSGGNIATDSRAVSTAGSAQAEQDQEDDGQSSSRRGGRRLVYMKMWQLTEYLDLSEEQADQMLPLMQASQRERDEHRDRSRTVYRTYVKKLDAGQVTRLDIVQYLDDRANLDRTDVDLRLKEVAGFETLLELEQMAKYVVFDERLRERLYRVVSPPRPNTRRRSSDED